jgi:hypothetical protein
LGVSFFRYIHDRIAGFLALPNLADLIRHRSPASHPVATAPNGSTRFCSDTFNSTIGH